MAGIEILATQEVATEFVFNWTVFWVLFSVVLGVSTLAGVDIGLGGYGWSNSLAFILIGIMLGLSFGGMVGSLCGGPTAYETQYKATISDEVSMNEFLEKYEIIDQEGKIYTIREK